RPVTYRENLRPARATVPFFSETRIQFSGQRSLAKELFPVRGPKGLRVIGVSSSREADQLSGDSSGTLPIDEASGGTTERGAQSAVGDQKSELRFEGVLQASARRRAPE